MASSTTNMKDILNSCTQELEAVIQATEKAAHDIMDAAEAIQKLLPSVSDAGTRTQVQSSATKIVEASTFQDLTGQRIRKVLEILAEITKSGAAGAFATAKPGDTRPDAHLLNGPQLGKDTPSQDDVDKLFNK